MEKIGDLSEIRGERIIEWKVKDFFALSDVRYHSPDFNFLGVSWNLRLCPNGESINGSEGWISLYLMRISAGYSLALDYSLALKSTDINKNYVEKITASVFDKKDNGRGRAKLILRSALMERKADLVPSGEITIICTLENTSSLILPPTAGTGKSYIRV